MSKKKKSYNPFKMWGSWIGAFLITIIPLPIPNMWEGGFVFMSILPYMVNIRNSLIGFIFVLFLLMIGFLIGWGIHSLIRRFRR